MDDIARSPFDPSRAEEGPAHWAPMSPIRGFRRSAGVTAAVMVPLLVLALAIGVLTPARTAAAPPAGFSDTLVAGVPAPTALAFTPDGRILVTTQQGELRIYSQAGTLLATPLNLAGRLCSGFERGLLGVAVDPAFPNAATGSGHIYLYYTFKKFPAAGCPANTSQAPVNRVSRFVMAGNTVDAASETVLIDNIPSPNGNHNGGDLQFGKDGLLYVGVGDGGCDLDNAGLCAGANTNGRDNYRLVGKILRITKDGGIPAGNFAGVRCNVTGGTSPGNTCAENFATGLRNPFRIAFDPNASGTRFYINDVGQNAYEEIDEGIARADYGWNTREGFCATGTTNCGAPPAGMTNPVHAYNHGTCNSITGGAFVPNGVWPAQYNGVYLFSDYTCGTIFQLAGGASSTFATGLGSAVVLAFGPHGSTKALYYTTYSNGGQIRRIAYTAAANRPPVANATANPTVGALPLAVNFDGRGSSDPDGGTLSYDWDFGDGTAHGSGSQVSHTYTTAGVYTARLTVSDPQGATNSTTLRIDAGNTAPTPTITEPTTAKRFRVGETITLRGSATDEGAPLPDSALSWTVILHHDTHTHPFLGPTTGNNITFTAPAPEDFAAAANSYLEIRLTATDAAGLSRTISQNLDPNKVNVTFATDPAGLRVEVNGTTLTGPTTRVSWEGYGLQVNAPAQTDASGQAMDWASWSDGGARAHTITTPASAATYTATFRSSATGTPQTFVAVADARVAQSSPNTRYGTSTYLQVVGGSASDIESYLRFTVSGVSGSVSRATLRVFLSAGSVDGPAVYPTSTGWTETGITWNTRPARTGGASDDKGGVSAGAWMTLDVTPLVTGNGTFAFVLATTSPDSITAYSRERTTNRPELVIEAGGGGGGGDTQAPTAPTNLSATAASATRVDLSWTAATDNVGVTAYDVYRNGALLRSLGNQTTYADTTAVAATTYQYQVKARDATGNASAFSNTASATTPSGGGGTPGGQTFAPDADARVWERTRSSNFGTSSQLIVQGGSALDSESYLRFSVSGLAGPVQSATLRLFVPNSSSYGTTDGPAVYTAGNTWTETGLTWSNRPPRSTTPRDDKGAIPHNAWVEYDVTALVTGNGTYTFVLATTSTDAVTFASRQTTTPPQLVITTGSGPSSLQAAGADEPQAAAVETVPTATPTPVPPTPTPMPVAVPALPYVDGFETGDLSAWTAVKGLTVQQEVVATGVWAARAQSVGEPAVARKTLATPQDELYARVRFNLVNRREGEAVTLLRLRGERGEPLLTVHIDGLGDLGYRVDATGATVTTARVTEDVWHEVQLHVRIVRGATIVELWYDGALLRRAVEDVGSVAGIGEVQLGEEARGRSFDVAFDEVALDERCIGDCTPFLATPTPTPTPEPPMPEPTATPVPTSTATPEPEPPTATLEPPTATPEPPTATATPEPPQPTPEPAVQEDPAPEETPAA